MDKQRPTPEEMLARAEREAERARRGRLKVFFGATPGVGKTYAMLEAARARSSQGTGVTVRETVPDSLIDAADEIEVVDLPPDELLQRLAEGKVYLPTQAAAARENFFQKGNLIALRELVLRRAAERVEAQGDEWKRE